MLLLPLISVPSIRWNAKSFQSSSALDTIAVIVPWYLPRLSQVTTASIIASNEYVLIYLINTRQDLEPWIAKGSPLVSSSQLFDNWPIIYASDVAVVFDVFSPTGCAEKVTQSVKSINSLACNLPRSTSVEESTLLAVIVSFVTAKFSVKAVSSSVSALTAVQIPCDVTGLFELSVGTLSNDSLGW